MLPYLVMISAVWRYSSIDGSQLYSFIAWVGLVELDGMA